MADIISIATAEPPYQHLQTDICKFMQASYQLDANESRKLKFLYDHSGINTRYSIIGDYNTALAIHDFIPLQADHPFPDLEKRMEIFEREALLLSIESIKKCINGFIDTKAITHLITVSCTGMSAPGLDLQIMQSLELPSTIFRTSINFMGCYAAIHGLKLAKMICDSTPNSNVIVVATELCTLHFQQAFSEDNAASSLLFADGSAAVLISNCTKSTNALVLKDFYAQVEDKGQNDMAWKLSSKGFLMTLSSYIPQLIEADVEQLIGNALAKNNLHLNDVSHWCIHPGGKRILDLIQRKMKLSESDLQYARKVLFNHGNMSSPTVLYVLKEIMEATGLEHATILGMAFGPGLTMETFTAVKSS
jgi:predicted naringenin-chalcone synthase